MTETAMIPSARRADWYARRVGVAAAREINVIPAARQSTNESRLRAAGMTAYGQGRNPGLVSGHGMVAARYSGSTHNETLRCHKRSAACGPLAPRRSVRPA